MPAAEIRAPMAGVYLRSVERVLGADKFAKIEASVPDAVTAIRTAGSLDWLDMRHQHEVALEVLDRHGVEMHREIWRKQMIGSFELPLFRHIPGLLKAMGGTPKVAFKRSGVTWRNVSRGAGDIECVRLGEHDAELVITAPWDQHTEGRKPFLLGWVGTFQGLLEFVGAEGGGDMRFEKPDYSVARYEMYWR